MKEKPITRVTFNQLDELEDLSDWERVKAMTDEEAYQKALSDPDNQPLSESDLEKLMRRKVRGIS